MNFHPLIARTFMSSAVVAIEYLVKHMYINEVVNDTLIISGKTFHYSIYMNQNHKKKRVQWFFSSFIYYPHIEIKLWRRTLTFVYASQQPESAKHYPYHQRHHYYVVGTHIHKNKINLLITYHPLSVSSI